MSLDEGERGEYKSCLKTMFIQKSKVLTSGPFTSWQIEVKKLETVTDFLLLGSKMTADDDFSHKIKNILSPWKKSYDKPRQRIKKQRHHFVGKGSYSQSYGFSSSHIWM